MPQRHIESILSDFKLWGLAVKPQFVLQLVGGLTNQTFLISYGGQQLVVRVFAENSEQLNIDRHAEWQIASIAAEHGLAAEPLYICSDCLYSVSYFIEGDIFNEVSLQEDKKLEILALTLKQLHSINVEVDLPALDISEKADSYWRAIDLLDIEIAYHPHKDKLQQFFKCLPQSNQLSLCHNDLVMENMIVRGGELKLIDWEYASLGDAYFDLASVIINQAMTEKTKAHFLTCYGEVDEQALSYAQLQVYYLEWLWWVIQRPGDQFFLDKKLVALLRLIDKS